MRLKKFLEYFEFDYRYEDEYIALVDITEANLGDIESERFSKDNLSSIVDCLDIYYKDYIFDDLAEEYGVDPDDWQAIYQKAMALIQMTGKLFIKRLLKKMIRL